MTEGSRPLKVFGFGAFFPTSFVIPSFHIPFAKTNRMDAGNAGQPIKGGAKIVCGKEAGSGRIDRGPWQPKPKRSQRSVLSHNPDGRSLL